MNPNVEVAIQRVNTVINVCNTASDVGAFHVVFHPFYAATTLIKMGYEPLPPAPDYSIFKGHTLVLPGVIPYARYLWFVDGFPAIFRSALPCVCKKVVSVYTRRYIDSISPYNEVNYYYDETPQLYERFTEENMYHFANRRLWAYLANIGSVIASHPFRVVALHCVSAFVNGSQENRSPIRCLMNIIRTEGVRGLFAGVVPLCLGKTLEALISSVVYIAVMNSMQAIDWRNRPNGRREANTLETLARLLSNSVAASYSSQFYAIADIMIINGKPMTDLGNPPFNPVYSSWIDCWSSYPRHRPHHASYLFSRPYQGPTVINWDPVDDDSGFVKPLIGYQHFGPTKHLQKGQSPPWMLQKYYAALSSLPSTSKLFD